MQQKVNSFAEAPMRIRAKVVVGLSLAQLVVCMVCRSRVFIYLPLLLILSVSYAKMRANIYVLLFALIAFGCALAVELQIFQHRLGETSTAVAFTSGVCAVILGIVSRYRHE
jgi:hypothetical protein